MINYKVFFIILNILFLLAILEQKFWEKKKIFSIVGIVVLGVVIATRNDFLVDKDYDQFRSIYSNNLYRLDVERLYLYLNIVFKKITKLDYIFFSFFYGVLSLTLVSKAFDKMTLHPNLCMFIYYGVGFFSKNCLNIRSGMATSIFIFSLSYLLNNKKIKYLIGIFLSMGIHFGGSIYLLFLFMKIKIVKKYMSLIFFITILISISILFLDIKNIILIIAKLPLGKISDKVIMYFQGIGIGHTASREIGVRGLTIYLNYLFYYILIKYKYIKVQKKEYYFFILFSIEVIFKLLSYKIIIFSRVVELFNIVDVFILFTYYNINLKNISKFLYKILYFSIMYIYIILSTFRTLQLMKG